MTGAMYAAIAGLKTHMQKLSVIGNNTANVNTYGFKCGNTGFEESMYTSLSASTAGGNQYGGTNASQIGYGSKVATIALNMNPGTYAVTNMPTDVCLTGTGFFLVGDKARQTGFKDDPNDLELTRYGRFTVDSDGYLVDYRGRCVYGFMPQGKDNGEMDTTENEDGNPIPVWDHFLRPIRLPPAHPDTGSAVYPSVDEDGVRTYGVEVDDQTSRVKADVLNISVDTSGKVLITNTLTGEVETVGIIAVGNVINPNGVSKSEGPYYKAGSGSNAGTVTVGTVGQTVTGYLNYNGDDAGGLEGDDAFDTDRILTGTGTGQIASNGLELSNTDVATEFADLITTQRGFQANTKIVTVTDEMLSDLVSMKR